MPKSKDSVEVDFFQVLENGAVTEASAPKPASEGVRTVATAAVNESLTMDAIVSQAVAGFQALQAQLAAKKESVAARISAVAKKVEEEKAARADLAGKRDELDAVRARNEDAAKKVEALAADDSVEYAPKAKKAA